MAKKTFFAPAVGALVAALLFGSTSVAAPPASQPLYRWPAHTVEQRYAGQVVRTWQKYDKSRHPLAYLTFDDGPDVQTPHILDTLARFKARATFFVVGSRIQDPWGVKLVRREALLGNGIGNHTWDHPNLRNLSLSDVRWELFTTSNQIIYDVKAKDVCYRPPYGSYNTSIVAMAGRMGKPTIFWSVDTGDWTGLYAVHIADRVISQRHPGMIVLMHDGVANSAATAKALPSIIVGLRNAGYRLGVMCLPVKKIGVR